MSSSKLIELTYFDPKSEVRLTAYADTIILDHDGKDQVISAIRFGGYPEMVKAMSDAIYGGVSVDIIQGGTQRVLKSRPKGYERQLSHDGAYAVATLMASDGVRTEDAPEDSEDKDSGGSGKAQEAANTPPQPRKCYIFCPAGDRDRLFEELDRKTAAPLIPEFRDCLLEALNDRGELRPLEVISIKERLDAWVLDLLPEDKNVVEILGRGLENGSFAIPGGDPNQPDGFEDVENITGYLNTFGITVADRIRHQFQPLFDPASEPLSEEVLAVNDYIQSKAGYSLYDAQLAVAEAVKRQLDRKDTALIIAECGSGKTKIGSTALGALYGMRSAQHGKGLEKTFNVVMSPSHVTKKWVREIAETLPDAYAYVVRSINDLDRLYAMYEAGDKSVYAVLSKEKARDGYMRYPAVTWNRRQKAFLCPDCGKPLEMEISDDGSRYMVNADQFFFQTEHKKNHKCPNCGSLLWAPVVPGRQIPWVKIGGYGWVYREQAFRHTDRTKNAAVLDQLHKIAENPDGYFPVKGAVRRYPLSTYIKKKLRGRIDGFLADELHEYNNASGQGDAMAEIYGAAKQFVGMTATLINGYSSGIFHLLYRIVPGLMLKDGKSYRRPSDFDAEYGVVENTYEVKDGDYNSNRRTTKRKTKSKKLPGVSPLVFSRFLLEYTAFLSLSDMGKDLPDYEEIPVPLEMPEEVSKAYKQAESILQTFLKGNRKAANKLLSAYLNLLTVYPDQPYDQPDIIDPMCESGKVVLVHPQNAANFETILPKEEKTLEIVRRKIAAGERVLIYTSWTRTDSQQKLLNLLTREGFRTEILTPTIPPEKREAWVEKRVASGLQVLITNPRCVETGLDLNAFTTLIFYSMGYNLFTLRQASRRSWRINQTAPRVEVYMLYYAGTMQAKAMKLMASKLAVAGIIEGSFSEEGLAAMSDVQDMTSQMAKELALGIKDNVEDIAAAFKKMAVINPQRKRVVPAAVQAPEVMDIVEVLQAVPVEETAPASSTRSADAQRKQALYEGLLQKSMEEQKKRKPKKRVEVENQISLFEIPAA
nr:helicase-related protein [uncultured Oscillibacter sp.]